MVKISNNKIGRHYSIANMLLVLSSFVFYQLGYIFFVVLIVRVVHDLTAFIFYIIHDHNRNKESPKQVLYRLLKPLKVPVIILSPIIALLIAAALTLNISHIGFYPFLIVGYMHYFLESRIWKNGTPHRENIIFLKS